MKKILIFLMLLFSFIFSQQEILYPVSEPTGLQYPYPFVVKNDTLKGADTLISKTLYLSKYRGAISLEFQLIKAAGNGNDINIYWTSSIGGLPFTVPLDSLTTATTIGAYKCLKLATIDSVTVYSQPSFIIHLANKDWFGWQDEAKIIIVSSLTTKPTNRTYVKSRARGQ